MDYDQTRQQRSLRRIAIISVGLTALVSVILFVLLNPKYKDFSAHETAFSDTSFAELVEEDIYSYNQIAFTKTNIASGETKVLNSGSRLPGVDTLFWGSDTGAIITFSETGLTKSILTDELAARGLEVDDRTIEFVWYFDFKASKLSLVSEQPLLSDTVHFSPQENAFYLNVQRTRIANEEFLPPTILKFTPDTGNKETVKTLEAGEIVTTIDHCYDSTTTCYIANKDLKTAIVRVNDNTPVVLTKEYELIQPTHDPSVFIGYIQSEANGTDTADETVGTSELILINLLDKSEEAVPITVTTGSQPVVNMSDGSFFVFTSSLESDSQTYHKIGKRLIGGYTAIEDELTGVDEQIAPVRTSYGKDGASLVQDVEGGIYLITPRDSAVKLAKENQQSLQDIYRNCIDDSVSVFEHYPDSKRVQVGIVFDQNFVVNQKKLADCIATTNPEVMIGQDFTIIGTNPLTGRYATN